MRIDEEGHEVHESAILDNPQPCKCPDIIKKASAARGINCQSLFQSAYKNVGADGSVARAVFAVFVSRQCPTELIPSVVRDFADRAMMMPGNPGRSGSGKCMGCMLEKNGFLSYLNAYSRIHPEIDPAFLEREASGRLLWGKPSTPLNEAWMAMIESGVVGDDDCEDLNSLMRSDDNLG